MISIARVGSCTRSNCLIICLAVLVGVLAPESGNAQSVGSALLGPGTLSSWDWFDRVTCLGSPELGATWTEMNVRISSVIEVPGNLPIRERADHLQHTNYRLTGTRLALSQPIHINNDIMLRLSAGILLPINPNAEDVLDFRNTTFLRFLLGRPDLRKEYETSTEWWQVDGQAHYRLSEDYFLVGGVRYEFWDTHYSDPPLATAGTALLSAPQNTRDVTTNIILPYIGLQYSRIRRDGSLCLRVVTWPWLSGPNSISKGSDTQGNARFETSGGFADGYFAELYLAVGKRLSAGLYLTCEASIEWLHATAQTEQETVVPTPGDIPFNAPVESTLDRRIFSVGGKVSIDLF